MTIDQIRERPIFTEGAEWGQYYNGLKAYCRKKGYPGNLPEIFSNIGRESGHTIGVNIDDGQNRFHLHRYPLGSGDWMGWSWKAEKKKSMHDKWSLPDKVLTVHNPYSFLDRLAQLQRTMHRSHLAWVKQQVTNIWSSATVYDFSHPEQYLAELDYALKDTSWEDLDKMTSRDAIPSLDETLWIHRQQSHAEFEAPYELHIAFAPLGHDAQGIDELPRLTYGRVADNRVRLNAIQMPVLENLAEHQIKEAETAAASWQDTFLKEADANPSGFTQIFGAMPDQVRECTDPVTFISKWYSHLMKAHHIGDEDKPKSLTSWGWAMSIRPPIGQPTEKKKTDLIKYLPYRMESFEKVAEILTHRDVFAQRRKRLDRIMPHVNTQELTVPDDIKYVGSGALVSLCIGTKLFADRGIATIEIPTHVPLRTHPASKELDIDMKVSRQILTLCLRLEAELTGVEVDTQAADDLIRINLKPPIRAHRQFIREIFEQIGN